MLKAIKKNLGYCIELLKKKKHFYIFTVIIFLISLLIGIIMPDLFGSLQDNLIKDAGQEGFMGFLVFFLLNNLGISLVGMLAGAFFGIVPLILIVLNGYMIGTVIAASMQSLSLFEIMLRFIPHGIFEMPAIIISLGFGISSYSFFAQRKNRQGPGFRKKLAIYLSRVFRLFFCLIAPLLIAGAIVESLMIAHISSISAFFMQQPVRMFLMNLGLAYMFYGFIKFLLLYLKKRESRYIVLLSLFLLLASDLWMYSYGHVLKEFFEAFQLIANILPLVMFLIYIYLEHKNYKERKDKQMIKDIFGHYVSPSVINELIKDPGKLKLGGEKKNVTIFFSDIRGFTTFSEKMNPHELVSFINRYMTAMTEIILMNRGLIDKYIGDAIMAFWGAPIDEEKHAHLACSSALMMVRELDELNLKLKGEGYEKLRIGIGLNTGDIIVGNMGSEKRFDYTIIGDHVNLGSRLEGLNKVYSTTILISEFTYALVKDDFACRKIDIVRVKGRDSPVSIYELIGRAGELDSGKLKMLDEFEEALGLYFERKFDPAMKRFSQIYSRHNDETSQVFVERCAEFIMNPPPSQWEGSTNYDTK